MKYILLACIREWCLGVASNIPFGELEHEAINLLRFSRKTECLQERTKGIDERKILEVHHIDECVHYSDVLFVAEDIVSCRHTETVAAHTPFSQVLADHGLAQAIGLQQEFGDILGRVARYKASLEEELNALDKRVTSTR